MKSKDVKCPFKWETRCSYYDKQQLYVPEFFIDHNPLVLPPWEHPSVFANNNPVHVEFCSGNGEWIIDKATRYPDINWVSVEILFRRVKQIIAKKETQKLDNLLVVSGEAEVFAKLYLQESSIQGAYVNFPDPWPKDRHAKHRVIQKNFIEDISKGIAQGGFLRLVTDDKKYCEQMMEEISLVPSWENPHKESGFLYENPDYGSSFFERLWRSKGLAIHYLEYINRKKNGN